MFGYTIRVINNIKPDICLFIASQYQHSIEKISYPPDSQKAWY